MKTKILFLFLVFLSFPALYSSKVSAQMNTVASLPAQEFANRVYNGILGPNFILSAHTLKFPENLPHNNSELGNTIKSMIHHYISAHCLNRTTKIFDPAFDKKHFCTSAAESVFILPLEPIPSESAPDIFADWIYRVDGDNWYPYESLLQETNRYLNSHERQLFIIRDFDNNSVMVDDLTTNDLPIVIDTQEKTLTIWTLELAD